ncbi:uncharacterized protein EI90DRAFT_1740452 [Cantharellus anzutake]|uniref:uncharacterized protein n=1 Tax=Cantharellus anzutake TaxID=1750568 RepID=UPI0019049277|nr:uncharacterized protein EI90DRAFT_1740452 [Cantharellus anzutake]KAF8341459.1 hypothetical protein EI90DRAFT_1740452 [Cantharellus anzutake]
MNWGPYRGKTYLHPCWRVNYEIYLISRCSYFDDPDSSSIFELGSVQITRYVYKGFQWEQTASKHCHYPLLRLPAKLQPTSPGLLKGAEQAFTRGQCHPNLLVSSLSHTTLKYDPLGTRGKRICTEVDGRSRRSAFLKIGSVRNSAVLALLNERPGWAPGSCSCCTCSGRTECLQVTTTEGPGSGWPDSDSTLGPLPTVGQGSWLWP